MHVHRRAREKRRRQSGGVKLGHAENGTGAVVDQCDLHLAREESHERVWLTILAFSGGRTRERSDRGARPLQRRVGQLLAPEAPRESEEGTILPWRQTVLSHFGY